MTQTSHNPASSDERKSEASLNTITPITFPTQIHLHSHHVVHHPRAGLNPIVDAAAYLFTLIGEFKTNTQSRALGKLQKELIQEITTFQESIKAHGYHSEYIIVCRYVLCATIDELILATAWGEDQWETYCLLSAFQQDPRHQEKFFSIMERAIKEPDYYIDLMELMYICLSMGYRGRYRLNAQDPTELEQINNALYKHISAYRGSFSKTLSPTKPPRSASKQLLEPQTPYWVIGLISACIIMTIFISLAFITEISSNETFDHVTDIQKSMARAHQS